MNYTEILKSPSALYSCSVQALFSLLKLNQGIVVEYQKEKFVVCKRDVVNDVAISIIPLSEVAKNEEFEYGDIINLKFNTIS